jgi:hypothetical protein
VNGKLGLTGVSILFVLATLAACGGGGGGDGESGGGSATAPPSNNSAAAPPPNNVALSSIGAAVVAGIRPYSVAITGTIQ